MKKKTENLISLAEFRRMFGVPARTLRFWISTGRIPALKIPNGRGGFSKRIRRLQTVEDLIILEKTFSLRYWNGGFSKRIKWPKLVELARIEKKRREEGIASRPARGPCPKLPLPKDKTFREAVREFTHATQKKGEIYQKKGKPLLASWWSILESYKIPGAEIESAIINKAKKIRL